MFNRIDVARLAAVALGLLCLTTAVADEQPPQPTAAEKLQAATVTVRISAAAEKSEVTVVSGVSLGDGLLVTPLFTPDDVRVRITIAGGMQAEATPLVLDEHSGLALLAIDNKDLPKLELAEDAPRVGSTVLTGAAWGVEKAVVSQGIVGGVDRTLPGMNYPPLLQCDLRTAETSSGAAVVDRQGRLLGVVVAAQSDDGRRGWTYAVPVKHIRRLLRSWKDNDEKREGVVVLKRRRPIVGMVLGPDEDRKIVVKRVQAEGPAAKAGIEAGDEVLAADEILIRSVYQAVRPLLYKQPGDTMKYLVRKRDGVHRVEVVLSGGVVMPAAPGIKLAHLIQPKLVVGPDAAVARTRRPGTAEVFAADGGPEPAEPGDETIKSLTVKLNLQAKALDGYRTAISILNAQLTQSRQDQQKAGKLSEQQKAQIEQLKRQLKSLQAEFDRLKKQGK